MISICNAVSKNGLLAVLVAASALTLPGCGKSAPEAGVTPQQSKQIKPQLEEREAMMAVEFAVANIDALQNSGGYQNWTAEKVVEKVVPLMNSAQAPAPGVAAGAMARFVHVAERASGPWQVVIRAEGDTVHVEAYGSSTDRPLETRSIRVH